MGEHRGEGDRDRSAGPLVCFAASLVLWFGTGVGTGMFLLDTNVGAAMALPFSAALSLPALLSALLSRKRAVAYGYVLASVFALLLIATPWHPKKRFQNDLFGMVGREEVAVAQAKARMAKYFEVEGVDNAGGSLFYRWDRPGDRIEDGVGEVRIRNGKVSGAELH